MAVILDKELIQKYYITDDISRLFAREFYVKDKIPFLIYGFNEKVLKSDYPLRLVNQLPSILSNESKTDFVSCKLGANKPRPYADFRYIWYDIDPNKPLTIDDYYEQPNEIDSIWVTFQDVDKIMFVQYTESIDDKIREIEINEKPLIIYPIKKLESTKNREFIYVMKAFVLPDVFNILGMDFPGDNIKG